MSPHQHAHQVAAILAAHPQLAFDLYCAASEIVDDFEDYGPVLQANEASEYDDTTAILKLRMLRKEIMRMLQSTPGA